MKIQSTIIAPEMLLILSIIFESVTQNQNGDTTQVYFNDKTISAELFSIISVNKYPDSTYGLYFHNGNTGDHSLYFILSIGIDLSIDGNSTYGNFLMSRDCKLSFDTCKMFYDLNISIYYYIDNCRICYDEAAIKRIIAINTIL